MRFFEKIGTEISAGAKYLAAKWRSMKESKKESNNDESVPVSTKFLDGWKQFLKFKKVFLAVPVAGFSVILAMKNLFQLPALVGIGLQGNGEYTFQIIREVAVLGPLAVTAVCLLLMFLSKRTLTPWMVSVFSLLLPVMILITNTFPG